MGGEEAVTQTQGVFISQELLLVLGPDCIQGVRSCESPRETISPSQGEAVSR